MRCLSLRKCTLPSVTVYCLSRCYPKPFFNFDIKTQILGIIVFFVRVGLGNLDKSKIPQYPDFCSMQCGSFCFQLCLSTHSCAMTLKSQISATVDVAGSGRIRD